MGNVIRSRLTACSLAYLASAGLGTVLALRRGLAADFAGLLRGGDITRDFLGFVGTALSPPLPLLIAQIVLTALAWRPGRAGVVGAAGLSVLGICYAVGQIGEAVTWQPATGGGPGLPVRLIVAANILVPLAMVVSGLLAWRGGRRRRQG